MPNIILTNSCTRRCAYCFTNGDFIGELTLGDLREMLPFLDSFPHKSLNILGGEPSLNPDFMSIVRCLLDEGYQLHIFTNGDIPQKVLRDLQALAYADLAFVVNRTDEELSGNVVRFYKALGHEIKIGVTVFESGQNLRHTIREIEEYRLKKAIRIGIALPSCLAPDAVYLKPDLYQKVSGEMFAFLTECIGKDITPEFDCGFPFCFFTDEQKRYLRDHDVEFASNCGFIPDILPDQTVIPCFPLAGCRVGVRGGASWSDARQALSDARGEKSGGNIYEECATCEHIDSHRCCGGCAAFAFAPTGQEAG